MTLPYKTSATVHPSCDWDGCDAPKEHTCASCDRALCDEHGVYSRGAGEWFCEPDSPHFFHNTDCEAICDERHRRWVESQAKRVDHLVEKWRDEP